MTEEERIEILKKSLSLITDLLIEIYTESTGGKMYPDNGRSFNKGIEELGTLIKQL